MIPDSDNDRFEAARHESEKRREETRAALLDAGGNRAQAAAKLGISRNALWKRMTAFPALRKEFPTAGPGRPRKQQPDG